MKKLLAAVTALTVSTAQAGVVIHVDAGNCPGPGDGSALDPYCSIQTAIDSAVHTDEIVVAPGTYFETIDFLGKAVTLRSANGPAATILDGQQGGSVVTCTSGEGPATVLDGFTITGGSGLFGGGMNNAASSPTVIGCAFSGNTAVFFGSGMSNDGGSPTVTGCTFAGNSADFSGGGMLNFNGSSATITACTFTGNRCLGGNGAGMSNNGSSPAIVDCVFIDNEAIGNVADGTGSGGGMGCINGSNPMIAGCTFSRNRARADAADHTGLGGGIYCIGSNPTILDCTFSGNEAIGGASSITGVGGGAYFNSGSSPELTDCTFSGNTATVGTSPWTGIAGAMLCANGSSATVTRCSFIGNAAIGGDLSNTGFGGALWIEQDTTHPGFTGCMFAGNTTTGGTALWSGVGGAVACTKGAAPTFADCAFIGNTSTGDGGAVHSRVDTLAPNPTLINCTLSRNTAGGSGGAIYHVDLQQVGSTAELVNCIVWDNGPAPIVDVGDAATTVTYSVVTGGWPGVGNIDADPLFVDPLDGDFHLRLGSTCIDAGLNAAVPSGTSTDLNGTPRFVDDPDTPDCQQAPGQCGDPPVVDMGAWEFQLCPWDCGDDDGDVGIVDFLALLANWGPCP